MISLENRRKNTRLPHLLHSSCYLAKPDPHDPSNLVVPLGEFGELGEESCVDGFPSPREAFSDLQGPASLAAFRDGLRNSAVGARSPATRLDPPSEIVDRSLGRQLPGPPSPFIPPLLHSFTPSRSVSVELASRAIGASRLGLTKCSQALRMSATTEPGEVRDCSPPGSTGQPLVGEPGPIGVEC